MAIYSWILILKIILINSQNIETANSSSYVALTKFSGLVEDQNIQSNSFSIPLSIYIKIKSNKIISCRLIYNSSIPKLIIDRNKYKMEQSEKVNGIGGVFFKSQDTEKLKAWYQENLGIVMDQYGSCFEWYQHPTANINAFTQWSLFSMDSNYLLPSEKDFMLNYRVGNLEKLVDTLKLNGIGIVDTIQIFEYGKFAHILDPEGNKIELWEPNDLEFEKIVGAKTS